mgnify:CR=1 FL=1|jgi:hypothetical protein|tara:strand:+ start:2361 stop:2753 length:393 start_codon:yes stop_codon:yes gene_type:complete
MNKIDSKQIPMTIPFMPNKIEYTGCKNILLCGRLFIPCSNELEEGQTYCKKCKGKEEKYGTYSRRLYLYNHKKQFVSPSNIKEIDYVSWLKKNKRTYLEVQEELKRLNIPLTVSLRISKRSPSISSDEEE